MIFRNTFQIAIPNCFDNSTKSIFVNLIAKLSITNSNLTSNLRVLDRMGSHTAPKNCFTRSADLETQCSWGSVPRSRNQYPIAR